ARQIAPQPRASVKRRLVATTSIESKLIDEVIPAAALSDLQIRTRTGGQPTEVPPRSPTQISGQKEVWMVPDGHAALQGLSSIPHLTSVATGFYRNDVINGSETSAGRARAMMSEFAVAPVRLIDNCGRRAIEIALRPQHFKRDVLGMNRCHGRHHRATRGDHGGARLSLSSLLRRCGLFDWAMVPELYDAEIRSMLPTTSV
ncbi:hypothetical protein THAOC_04926, partial [Thalassiosira oceanica]